MIFLLCLFCICTSSFHGQAETFQVLRGGGKKNSDCRERLDVELEPVVLNSKLCSLLMLTLSLNGLLLSVSIHAILP